MRHATYVRARRSRRAQCHMSRHTVPWHAATERIQMSSRFMFSGPYAQSPCEAKGRGQWGRRFHESRITTESLTLSRAASARQQCQLRCSCAPAQGTRSRPCRSPSFSSHHHPPSATRDIAATTRDESAPQRSSRGTESEFAIRYRSPCRCMHVEPDGYL